MAEIICFAGEHAWAEGIASAIATRLGSALLERASATLLLAGGSTPAPVYRTLAASGEMDWSGVHFFWGDERHVPPDHSESNFLMAYRTLLQPLGITREDPRVHRIPTEGESARQDAALYDQNLRLFFHLQPGDFPRFDVVLLGMGDDGHTASLFPGTEALDEHLRLAVANPVPSLNSTRITVTLPLLNAARTVFFLVRGADKAETLAAVLDGPPGRYPAQRVRPDEGELFWMIDAEAARALPEGRARC